YEVNSFASGYFENTENGFKSIPLPKSVQVSCINSMVSKDLNGDGNLDLILGGNNYGVEVETTRNDASYGAILFGDGNGEFVSRPYSETGFFVTGEVRQLKIVSTTKGEVIIAGINNENVESFLIKE
ncbi:MAG: hypothetical protein OCD76_25820, partial [Reichenbachiella sp.]